MRDPRPVVSRLAQKARGGHSSRPVPKIEIMAKEKELRARKVESAVGEEVRVLGPPNAASRPLPRVPPREMGRCPRGLRDRLPRPECALRARLPRMRRHRQCARRIVRGRALLQRANHGHHRLRRDVPQGTAANLLVIVESVTGLVVTALATGLICRNSRNRAPASFSPAPRRSRRWTAADALVSRGERAIEQHPRSHGARLFGAHRDDQRRHDVLPDVRPRPRPRALPSALALVDGHAPDRPGEPALRRNPALAR